MSKLKIALLAIALCLSYAVGFAQHAITKSDRIKPYWIKSAPKTQNPFLSIIVAKEYSLSPDYSWKSALESLAANLPREWNVSSQTSINDASVINRDQKGITDAHQRQTIQMMVNVEGAPVKLNCQLMDSYWEQVVRNGQDMYECYQLFEVTAPNSSPKFDKYTLTTNYASDPATWGLSLIPGAAQMHKGSYLKGGLIMGGTVAIAGGLIACESLRKSYMAKISQTHSAEVKKAYNTMAGNCATARNICIGGLAALYIYNIIDAYIAPGARRVIVTPSATADGQYGMSLSYTF